MKFTEEFPSLKGRKLKMTTAEYVGRLVTDFPFRYKKGCGPTIRLCKEKDVQEHCIDKQRARDIIKKAPSGLGIKVDKNGKWNVKDLLDAILKELELIE